MEKLALAISLAVTVIISMDLSLSIILSKKKTEGWAHWNVVLCATLLGMCVFYTYNLMSTALLTGTLQVVMNIVFRVLFTITAAFLVTFICRVVNWLIAQPMQKLYIVLTFCNGLLYLGLSVSYDITGVTLLQRLQSVPMLLSIAYCLTVIIKSRKNIENNLVKVFGLVFVIISFSCLPLLVVATVFLEVKALCTEIILLAYFIVYLCFMFIAIEKAERKKVRETREPTVEDFAEYHITDRELEVILLIRKGMTNKEIGFELGISVNTVNNHIANIFQKTNVRSRIDLLNVLQEEVW